MKNFAWFLLVIIAAAVWCGCKHPASGAPASRPDSFNNEPSGVLWKWKKDE
jgi:hypothetical protein